LIEYPNKEFVIISDGFSLRELKLMKSDRHINVSIYSLIKSKLPFFDKLDEAKYPYYFVVDNNLEVSNVFFPMKSSSIIEKRYFNQFNSK